jgi:hypothetical protein
MLEEIAHSYRLCGGKVQIPPVERIGSAWTAPSPWEYRSVGPAKLGLIIVEDCSRGGAGE